jgi:molybdate transport system substrate-binding protein
MDAVITGGRVAEGSSRIFARNSLVIITPTQALAGIETPADLARPGVKLVLADEQVPVGRYARQALENLNEVYGPDFSRSVLANVVSNEDSVVGVTAKVRLGEADAGIVFVTDAAAEDSVKSIGIDEAHNVLAAYPIALVSDARSADVGRQFIEFLLSSDGQAILADFGFIPVEAG